MNESMKVSTKQAYIDHMNIRTYCLLLRLPRDLYNVICCEWLKLIELGILDRALTNSVLRDEWLNQLKSKSMNPMVEVSNNNCAKLNWIILRKIHWFDLKLWNNVIPLRRSHPLKYDNIRTLSVLNGERLTIKHCPNLTSLHLSRCRLKQFKIDVKTLSHLTSLKIEYCGGYTTSWYDSIANNCLSLKSYEDVYHNENYDYRTILQVNPQLIKVSIKGDSKLFNEMLQLCPMLKDVQYRFTTKEITIHGESTLKHLKRVHLIDSFTDLMLFFEDNCLEVAFNGNNMELMRQAAEMNNLTSITFNGNFKHFEADWIVRFIQQSSQSLLRVEVSSFICEVNTVVMALLACKQIQSISFSGIKAIITSESVIDLFSTLTTLKEFIEHTFVKIYKLDDFDKIVDYVTTLYESGRSVEVEFTSPKRGMIFRNGQPHWS